MRVMDVESKYAIDCRSLADGHHAFDFKVDDSLFEAMQSNEIKGGECKVHVEALKSESMLALDISISGKAVVECDRCLEDCDVPIRFDGQLTVRFSDTLQEYDGEQMWVAYGESVSLAQYIYESIVISLPYRRVHADGGCNPDMLARFTPASDNDTEEE